jgi:hypothetical protein
MLSNLDKEKSTRIKKQLSSLQKLNLIFFILIEQKKYKFMCNQ